MIRRGGWPAGRGISHLREELVTHEDAHSAKHSGRRARAPCASYTPGHRIRRGGALEARWRPREVERLLGGEAEDEALEVPEHVGEKRRWQPVRVGAQGGLDGGPGDGHATHPQAAEVWVKGVTWYTGGLFFLLVFNNFRTILEGMVRE